jgi:hypothetical protein
MARAKRHYMGGQHFIKEVLGRLKGEILEREDVSSRRALQGSWRSEKITDAVSSCLGISRDEVFQDRKDYRNMAISLMKVQTGMTNRDIGNLLGAMSSSAVAKAHARFNTRLSEDKALRRKVGHVRALLSTFKGSPHFSLGPNERPQADPAGARPFNRSCWAYSESGKKNEPYPLPRIS